MLIIEPLSNMSDVPNGPVAKKVEGLKPDRVYCEFSALELLLSQSGVQ